MLLITVTNTPFSPHTIQNIFQYQDLLEKLIHIENEKNTRKKKKPYHLEPGHVSDFLLRILFIAYKDIKVKWSTPRPPKVSGQYNQVTSYVFPEGLPGQVPCLLAHSPTVGL